MLGGLAASWNFLGPAWRGAWAALPLATVIIGIGFARPSALAPPLAAGAYLVAQGALWRLATGEGGLGPGGLQFGRLELRLAAVWLLSGAFLFVLGLLAFVAVLGFAYAAASAGPGFDPADVATWAPAVEDRGRILVTAVGLIAATALAWAATRISLASAATAARGRVQVLATWPLTRGRAGPILLARVLAGAGPAALVAIAALAARPGSGGASGLRWIAGLVVGVAVAGLWLPSSVGLMAYLYRQAPQPPVPE